MEDWHLVGDPGEPQFQNGWGHAYQNQAATETGVEGGGQWVLFPQEEPGTFKKVFLLPGWHPYPQWFIDYMAVALHGVSTKSSQYSVQFRKDNEGFVYVEGIAGKKGASAARWNLETIFTLPDTHRPAYREFVGEPGWVSTTTYNSLGFPIAHNYYLPGQYLVEPDGRLRMVRPGILAGYEAFYFSFRSKFLVLTPQ